MQSHNGVCAEPDKSYSEFCSRLQSFLRSYKTFEAHITYKTTGTKMPKYVRRTTNRGKWSQQDMKEAMKCVKDGKLSIRLAAARYDVPKSSLQDRVKAVNSGKEAILQPKLGRFDCTFSEHYELQLYNHVRELDNRLMPLTRFEFLKLAFELAESLKIPHRFNKEKRMAGKDFFYSFRKKYPNLVLRTPESTSISRAVGFNKPQVNRFYDLLTALVEKYKFPASRIYNADETGVSNVHKNDKVLSTKGKKQVGKLTSAERGRNITVMFAMNITGHFVPPLFIFPRKKMDKNGRLMVGAPPQSIAIPHESGWMNGDIFLQWMRHFKQHVQPSKENPVLLILDGHSSHKELAVIEYACENHIHMLSTPPHTTHKLQPLDRTFFKPFKSAFASASAVWMRRNPGARITDYDIAALVDASFSKAARLEIAQNGFKCSGIYPLNRDIFSDIDFLPASMTDIAEEPVFSLTEHNISQSSHTRVTQPTCKTLRSISALDLIQNLSPLPDASRMRLITRSRKTQKSEILTASSYKNDLLMKNKTTKRKQQKTGNIKTPETKRNKQKETNRVRDENTECIICGETFEEDWIQCDKCKDWAHEACVDIESSTIYYYCDVCKAKERLGNC